MPNLHQELLDKIDEIDFQMRSVSKNHFVTIEEKESLLKMKADLIIAEYKNNPLIFFEALTKSSNDKGFEELENHSLSLASLFYTAVDNNLFSFTNELFAILEYFISQTDPESENYRNFLDLIDSPTEDHGNSLLCLAVQKNPKADIVHLLLRKGADVNTHNSEGHTALTLALECENIVSVSLIMKQEIIAENHLPGFFYIEAPTEICSSVFEKLLDSVENINKRYSNGDTLLHCATQNDFHIPLVKLLFKKNPDLNLTDRNGDTCLHIAVSPTGFGDFFVLKALLDAGADPNVVDSNGNTPLHLISMSEDTSKRTKQMAKYLVKKGANTQIKNHEGLDVIQAAEKIGRYCASDLNREEQLYVIKKYPKYESSVYSIVAKTPGYYHYIPIWQQKMKAAAETQGNSKNTNQIRIEEVLPEESKIAKPDAAHNIYSGSKRKFEHERVI